MGLFSWSPSWHFWGCLFWEPLLRRSFARLTFRSIFYKHCQGLEYSQQPGFGGVFAKSGPDGGNSCDIPHCRVTNCA